MTLTRQLGLARLVLAFLAAILILALVGEVASGRWGRAAILIPFVLVGGWVLRLEWSMLSQQRPIAEFGNQLRGAARTVPAGTVRIYLSRTSDIAIHCLPSQDRHGSDQFSRVQMEDVVDIENAEPGELVSLHTTTYRVRRSLPMIWRHTGATQAVKGAGDGEYHASIVAPTSYRGAWKTFMLNHRTGVLVPDREELREVVHLIQHADRALDVPSVSA